MFEKASRLKLRFSVTGRGSLSVEDLWDLSREELDSTFRGLSAVVKQTGIESLIAAKKPNVVLNLKLGIIRHVYNVLKAERLACFNKTLNSAKIVRLTEILANKQDEALGEMSEDELATAIQELEAA